MKTIKLCKLYSGQQRDMKNCLCLLLIIQAKTAKIFHLKTLGKTGEILIKIEGLPFFVNCMDSCLSPTDGTVNTFNNWLKIYDLHLKIKLF